MAKASDFFKNKLSKHLWGGFIQANNYPNSSWYDKFNEQVTIDTNMSEWETSEYAKLSDKLTRALVPSPGIRKAIFRLAAMSDQNVVKNNLDIGYYMVDKKTKEIWCSYFDGTTEELAETLTKGSKCPRFINMYGHEGVIKKAFINENGMTTAYNIGSGKGEHSACAYMYFQLINKIYSESEEDLPLCIKFASILNNLQTAPATVIGRKLTLLENDLYIKVGMEEGQIPNIPFENFQFPEDDDTKYTAVGVRNDTDTKVKKTTVKVARIASVKNLVDSQEYFVEHEFSGDENLVPKAYDEYIVDDETLNAAKLIQKSSTLPQPPVINMLFTGQAGTGKSTAAQLIARICNLPYRFITMSADTTVADLLLNILPGKKANTFEHFESEFVKAFRYGGIVEIQEVNTVRKPNVLTSLNAALDDLKELHLPNGEVIKRHPDCVVIFTANIGYNGTSDMNQALLSRCFWKADYKLPDNKELIKRIVKASGIDKNIAERMVKTMIQIQNILEEEGEVNGICSFREVVAWAKATVLFDDPIFAAQNTIINSATFDEELKPKLEQAVCNFF